MKYLPLLPLAARGSFAALLLLGAFAGCGGEGEGPPAPVPPAPATWDFGLPAGYPKPKVPADNPMSVDKVELGRRLFYDKRLSGNETQSCASCHDQKLAFTDGRAGGLGSTGEVHPRSSMSIVNVGYLSTLTWANPLITELEEQALLPLFGETPVELGLAGKEDVLLERLRKEPVYEALFPKAFPDEADPVRLENVVRAIGAFERSVISYQSAWDRYNYAGDSKALSEAQKRGKDLFFSEKLECFHCHGGFNFSDSVVHDGSTFTETMFHNTGLYNLGGTGAYPEGNRGVYEVTQVSTDMGRFRAPTLRNITLTAPYMHDGSIATLSEVLDHYAAGGRTIADGPYAGVGSTNPYKSELINGFVLTEEEKADVLAFLAALTDDALLTDPRFADPWKQDSAGGMP
ncbi:methanobactin export MATE transporter MbnM [Polyangium sorediatum]|uniref:Di-heme enzyme n=1 Tax=Polyangium sorediatum TaxID=889274 RepID=A0ABT6P009_9BACT|nr:methanobactin export MATE transporter MbnM [Polyangium sorediatum]MDI1433924.1 di-heme enzyme [Polyangium sorediatum]